MREGLNVNYGRVLVLAAAAATVATTASARKDDDRPLAMVEKVANAPAATVMDFDYVYAGDKIDLRPDGKLTIAYFDNCVVESFQAGVISMREEGVKVTEGGQSTNRTMRPCQTAALALNAEATEAGVAVKRVDKLGSLLPEEAIKEITIAADHPRFVWPRSRAGGQPVRVSVHYLDADPESVVWQTEVAASQVAYPADAPALARGMPYKVVVSFDRGADISAVFSVDPGLELPPSPLNNVVPLGL